MPMNPAQQEAVEHVNGPCRVIAGAGSGKTTVLTHRIQHLINVGINPANILGITFTKKAATEMNERLAKLIGQQTAEKVFLGTFHSFGLKHIIFPYQRINKNNPICPSNGKKMNLLNDAAILSLVSRIVSPLTTALDTPIVSKIDPFVGAGFISWQKNHAILPTDALDYSYFNEVETMEETEKKDYAVLYKKYEELKRAEGAMDFDDMLVYTLLILSRDQKFRTQIRNQFKYILVDEFQDTNAAQYRIVKELASGYTKNVFIVGDARQAIYSWRASEVSYILDFEDEWTDDRTQAKTIELNDNYRSTVEIVDMSTKLIECSTINYPGICRSGRGNHGENVKSFCVDDDAEEAEVVAGIITDLLSKGTIQNYSDIAILYRTNAQSRTFMWSLMQAGIPFKVASGDSYFDKVEFRELFAFLKLGLNPKDVNSFDEIKNILAKSVSKETIAQIHEHMVGEGISLFDAINEISFEDKDTSDEEEALQDLSYMLNNLGSMQEDESFTVRECLYDVFNRIVYEDFLEERYKNKNKEKDYVPNLVQNLKDFFDSCERFGTISELMDFIRMQEEQMKDSSQNKVQLMSLHRSKGLEFDTVFLVGMCNGILPHSQSVKYDKSHKIILESIEEERRLCYVGITRAKERLYLCAYENLGKKKMHPSIFYEELKFYTEEISSADMERYLKKKPQ